MQLLQQVEVEVDLEVLLVEVTIQVLTVVLES
jgi:hypothetical protein